MRTLVCPLGGGVEDQLALRPGSPWRRHHPSGNVYVADTSNHRIQKFQVVRPAPPTLTSTAPASPANDNSPKILGSAPAETTVRLYSSADCSGTPAATGTASELASPGLAVSVADDSTTTFRATATDSTADTSACSAGIAYVEATTPPPTPVPPDPDDRDAPELLLAGKGTQRFGEPIVVRANCADQACKVARHRRGGDGRGPLGEGSRRRDGDQAPQGGHEPHRRADREAKAQDPKAGRRRRGPAPLPKAQARGGRGETARATIDATAADGFGNRSSDELTVKLEADDPAGPQIGADVAAAFA